MRPVEKKKPGDTVEFKTSMNERVKHTVSKHYKPYGDAKEPLAANIGMFCSYCEEPRGLADLHIEHIQPKSRKGAEYDWDNFLLSCSMCNTCKNDAEVNLETTHFPHLDNTYLDFIYEESGRVRVNPNLPVEEYKKAENLYNLVKMGRDPFGEEAASKRDFRWKGRYETWNLAKRFLEKYESGNLTVDDIIEIADKLGHWSVWFTVFKEHDEVRKNLIEHTSGTCTTCFDENNHYEPVCRERKV